MSLVRFRASYAPSVVALFLWLSFQSPSAQQSTQLQTINNVNSATPMNVTGKVANPKPTKKPLPRGATAQPVTATFQPVQPLKIGDTVQYSLDTVVVQTWFSTEPVILPASNFTFVDTSNADKGPCPKSKPVTGGQLVIDNFCVYDTTLSIVPYYTTKSLPNIKPAEGGSGDPKCNASDECKSQNNQAQDEQPQEIPITYREYLGWKKAIMYPIRPFIQPNATSISFSDQVGINSTPRWSLAINSNPAWLPKPAKQKNGDFLSYLSTKVNINLNNQVNANPNSSVGAFLWNLRSRDPLCRKWWRMPEPDVTISGVEYDFVSNDINVYFPSAGIQIPVAVLDKGPVPGVFVWRLQLGEISGWHIRAPSEDGLAGKNNQSSQIANEGNQLFRGVAGTTMNVQGWGTWLGNFSINSSYQVMLPATDEPFTIASTTSSKPPTITLTDKARHFVSSTISEKLGNSNFALSIKYQYGSLPPAFWLVKHSLTLGVTFSSGSGRSE